MYFDEPGERFVIEDSLERIEKLIQQLKNK